MGTFPGGISVDTFLEQQKFKPSGLGPAQPPLTLEDILALLQDQMAASSSSRTLGFGETQAGFEFQAAQERAAQLVGQRHDKDLLGLRNEFDKAQQGRDQAFARGEREAGQKFQERMNEIQQRFQAKEAEKQRDFQKELRKEDLKAERQKIFVDMLGKDPVRATLFALGVGGQVLPGGERFEDLPPLQGARNLERKTEIALDTLLAGQETAEGQTIGNRGGRIDLGSSGVTGLPPAIKAARAFQEGGAGAKSVLSSAFGIGDIRAGQQPGINPEEFNQLIQSVTPKGVIQG